VPERGSCHREHDGDLVLQQRARGVAVAIGQVANNDAVEAGQEDTREVGGRASQHDARSLGGLHQQVTGQIFDIAVVRDQQAVTAGLALPCSSAAMEGNVNMITMIKRQMYGRAAFPSCASA